ncbi:DUF1013 domain-containing protein [Paracoccaceae bacterium]|nr:DUF1013 domain-containing protein [Paracoccaceae bacterium]
MQYPLMRKATAVWLLDNTTLTFRQIANFCGLHELEINGIADGEVASGIRGIDPIINSQLTADEIKKCEANEDLDLQLYKNPAAVGENRSRGPKYTPLSKRQDKPAAIAWLVKFHPDMTDGQISRLIGTTKNTIKAIRERTHWNINNLTPTDPVALGLCKQVELQKVLDKMPSKKSNEAQVNDISETEIGVVEPSQALFNENTDKEH